MTFWSLTNSDFPTNQTFHQFHDIDTELDLHRLWVVSMENMQWVWHASRECLPFRTPGSAPDCGTCLCSNCWDQIPRTCHVFTRLSPRIPLGTFSILLCYCCRRTSTTYTVFNYKCLINNWVPCYIIHPHGYKIFWNLNDIFCFSFYG